MNNLIRIIVAILINLTFSVGVFAADASKDTSSGKIQSGTTVETEKAEQDDEQEEEEKETKESGGTGTLISKKQIIKDGIADYTIEVQKSRNEKLVKEIDSMLIREAASKEDRINAYKNIKKSFELRKKSVIESNKITDPSMKRILIDSLSHLIELLNKKIIELSK